MPDVSAGQVDSPERASVAAADDASGELTAFPREHDAIAERRKTYEIDGIEPRRALALSGGGIRSATFSLGLLRGLSELKLLPKIDYLSTVSGGGFTGAFYCGLFARRGNQEAIINPRPGVDLLGEPEAQRALGYLRQSGRYLTPAGFRDYIFAFALLFRNWVALTLVVGMVIVLAELSLDYFRAGLADHWPLYASHLWISPLALLLVPLAVCVLGAGWAYWLTISDVSHPALRPPLLGTLLIIVASGLWVFRHGVPRALPEYGDGVGWATLIILIVAVMALGDWIVSFGVEWRHGEPGGDHGRAIVEDRTRHRLTSLMAIYAQGIFWLTIFALADSASFAVTAASVAVTGLPPHWLTLGSPIVGGAIPIGRWLVRQLAKTRANGASRTKLSGGHPLLARFATWLAWIAALIFIGAALAFWGGIAHWVAIADISQPTHLVLTRYWPTLTGVGTFVVLAWFTRSFANLSSLATFYAARLRRAYLGAGNPVRIGIAQDLNTRKNKLVTYPVSKSHTLDDLGLHSYFERTKSGAPVHLINVTINATRGNGPATVQRDRHGLNLAISPDGMSYCLSPNDALVIKPLGSEQVGRRITRSDPRTKRPGQSLAVSTWVAISGAAFTTGLGSQTSLAKSILAFLANVRLGYWWNSDRTQIPCEGCYHNLLREMFASFHGTEHMQWYLSDGGHFENTGVYELVRRRLPFIILSDNGCDPHYGFEDIANLVRKCRIDFGATIQFLNAEDLKTVIADEAVRALFGGAAEFEAASKSTSAIARLARIIYADQSRGTLLIIKPRLTQDGPADLMRYLLDNPQFPQQTTLDQFFDEAQWESYYELGRLIATRLFAPRPGNSWQPNAMVPA